MASGTESQEAGRSGKMFSRKARLSSQIWKGESQGTWVVYEAMPGSLGSQLLC